MKLQYQLSIIFAVIILSAGLTMIIFTSELLNDRLEQNLITRENMAIEVLEKRVAPYLAGGNFIAITDILFDEKWTKKDMLAYIAVYDQSGSIVSHTFLADVPDGLRKLDHDVSEDFHSTKQSIGGQGIIELGKGVKEGAYTIGSIHLGYKEEYLKNMVRAIISKLMIFIAVLVFLTLFLGYFLSRLFVRPINQLVAGMEEVKSGNFSAHVNIDTKDELEMLANVFNKMTFDIKESHEKIDAHRRELELKVEERTKELNAKLGELTTTKNAVLNMMDDTEELNRELVQAQEKLNENLKMLKETDIKKNEFMSIAAHELKTPMTSIHGFSQLLQNNDIAKDPKKRDKYLRIMDHETTRLAKLVNDILDLSRVDLGATTFDIADVDVNEVVSAIKTEMNVQIKTKGLEAEYKIEKNLPKIRTDRERLTQILMNLINNAVKYTQKGKITITASKEEDYLHFNVTDTGIGISKKNQDKIFSRFYQVDSSYTRSAGGVGLGLSLCKEYIALLGGKIWFVSTAGKGSEFHFTLPIKGIPKKNILKIAKIKEIVNESIKKRTAILPSERAAGIMKKSIGADKKGIR